MKEFIARLAKNEKLRIAVISAIIGAAGVNPAAMGLLDLLGGSVAEQTTCGDQ